MRPKIFFGFLIPFSLLFISDFSSSEGLYDKIKRFVEGEADTLLVLSAEGLTSVRHSGNYFLFIQPKDPSKDSYAQGRKILLFEASKGIVWEKKFDQWGASEISVDESIPPKVTAGYLLDEGTGVTEIYNTKGTRVAEIRGPTVLYPSAGGTYFHTVPSPMEGGWLQVYDSLGNPLWSRAPIKGWNVAAPSDSFLVYADNDSLLVLKAKDGRTIVGWSGNPYKDKIGLTSQSVASKNGKFFLLSQSAGLLSSLFSFSTEAGFLWEGAWSWVKDKEYLADIALSPDGRILGATFVPKEQPTYRVLKFFDNFEKGRPTGEFKFDVGVPYTRLHQKSSIRVLGDMAIVVLPSSLDFYSWKGITDSTATKIFIFEPENRTVTDSFTVKGFFTPIASGSSGAGYFRITYAEENKKIFVLRSK